MTADQSWRRYLRFWRRDIARDVSDELAFHFDQRVQEYVEAGFSREAAVAAARERFGDVDVTRAQLMSIGERKDRRIERANQLESLRRDVAFSVRSLRRSPGFVLASILTISLGVGANAAMFSLADRLFLSGPRAVREPSSLRRIYLRTTWSVGNVPEIVSQFTYPAFTTLRDGLARRVRVVGFTPPDTMPLRRDAGSVTVNGSYVTSNYMEILGVHPAIGRFFAPDEMVMGQPVQVAVISNRLWRRGFARDTSVLGRTVEINHQRMTIIGVAPSGFTGTDLNATDVWMPLPSFPAKADGFWYKSFLAGSFLSLVGRIPPGTSDALVGSVGTTVVRHATMAGAPPGETNVVRDTGAVVLAGSLLQALGPTISTPPEVAISERLIGVTLIVLIIACANFASLLLVRAVGRRREIAVRLALGMSRSRLIRLLLVESVVLSLAAAVAALLVAQWAGLALRQLIMPDIYWGQPVLGARVIAFTLLVASATGIAAGLVPALQASQPELTSALKSGARDGVAGIGSARLRAGLLVAQVALSVVLLYGAGLFIRSSIRVHSADLGYDRDRLVYGTAEMLNPEGHYVERGGTPQLAPALQRTADLLVHAPDIESVALGFAAPMAGYAMVGLYFKDGRRPPRLDNRDPAWMTVTDSYFATTGLKLVRGRFFGEADRGDGPVMVVNETAARTLWPHEDAIGQCIVFFSMKQPCTTVIGIVRDARLEDVIEKPTVQLITQMKRLPDGSMPNARYVIVRARPGRTGAVAAIVRSELQRTLPSNALTWVESMDERLEPQFRPWRTGTFIFTGFGLLALLVSVVGTYSVIAYTVTQRALEMSVRMALGARAADLMRHVVGQSVRIVAIGAITGIACAIAAGGLIRSLLYDTTPRDPLVIGAVAILLIIAAGVAAAVPARRAGRADPVAALRAE